MKPLTAKVAIIILCLAVNISFAQVPDINTTQKLLQNANGLYNRR